MIDFNRVICFIFYASSSVVFNEIKRALIPIASALESNDLTIIFDQTYKGPGATTGAIANQQIISKEEFLDILKVSPKQVGLIDVDQAKHLIVITNKIIPQAEAILDRLQLISDHFHYNLKIHRLIFSDSTADEIKELIKEHYDYE